jgi:hypothetical protein
LGNEQAVLIRTSERKKYRGCKWSWKYTYLAGLETKARRGALSFGSMGHAALEAYYPPGVKRGQHPAEAFAELYDAQPDTFDQWDEEGNKVPARDLGIAMMNGYVEQYGTDPDFEMVAPEMGFQIDVLDEGGRLLCTYVGKMDGVARRRSTGKLVILEHKTAKSIPERVFINSDYGEQGLSYAWAATRWLQHTGVLGPDEAVEGVVFNFLRKALPDTRPQNEAGHRLNKPSKDALVTACEVEGLPMKGTIPVLTERLLEHGWTELDVARLGEPSKNQPAPLFMRQSMDIGPRQLLNFEKRLRQEAWEMRQVRQGKIPVYKSPSDWTCRMCDLRDVCEVHEMGGDWKGMLELDFKPWDPYSDHELIEEKR